MTIGTAVEETLITQRLLEICQGPRVRGRLVTELPGQCLRIDVVQCRSGVLLRQLFGERFEFRDVLQGTGPLTQSHALVAAEPLRALPVLTRPGGLQVLIEPIQLSDQGRVAECLLGQRVQFVALFLRQRVPETLRGRCALCQRIEQLLYVARVLGEVLAVLVHEVVELFLRVLTAGMLVE